MSEITISKEKYLDLKKRAGAYNRMVSSVIKNTITPLKQWVSPKKEKLYNIEELVKGFDGKEKEFWNYPPKGKEVW